jgi:acetyl esterase/lipase
MRSASVTRRGLTTTAAAALAAACSPLSLFNRFSPKDQGSRQVARDVAYGPGPRQKLDLYAPATPPEGGAPILTFLYGGSWDSGDRKLYAWAARAFASRGFVTAVPDYRLVPEVRFPAFVEDAAAAVAKAREAGVRWGGDPDRLVLAGHSAGAHIVMLLALDQRYLAASGLDPKSVKAAAGLAGPYDFYPFDVPASIAAFGQAPDPRATQPISFARADAPALFLAHGERDTLVYPRNSIRLAEAVRAKGGEAELKLYPALDHVQILLALSRPLRGKAPVLDDVTRFLHAHAG